MPCSFFPQVSDQDLSGLYVPRSSYPWVPPVSVFLPFPMEGYPCCRLSPPFYKRRYLFSSSGKGYMPFSVALWSALPTHRDVLRFFNPILAFFLRLVAPPVERMGDSPPFFLVFTSASFRSCDFHGPFSLKSFVLVLVHYTLFFYAILSYETVLSV